MKPATAAIAEMSKEEKLEAARKVKEQAYYAEKKSATATAAKKKAAVKIPASAAKVLADAGY